MTENGEGEKEYLEAQEAVRYLAQRWGIESYSPGAFRIYRKRLKLKPDIGTSNTALWKRETLDKIPKPREKKSAKRDEQHEADNTEDVA